MKYAAILFTIAIGGLLAGALILVATYGDDEEEQSPGTTAMPTATTTPAQTASTSATADALAGVCAENPDPATADVNEVASPLAGATVRSPVTVSGRIAAFEAVFRITIFAADGSEIADQQGMSAEGQMLSPFTEYVPFSVSEQTPACIWVYANSARDNEPIDVVQIPVTLTP